jgi:hypothetical protein
MQRLINPWEYRHLRAFGVTRIAGGFVAATAGVVCLSYAAYGWAAWLPGCWGAEPRGWLLVHHYRSLRTSPSLSPRAATSQRLILPTDRRESSNKSGVVDSSAAIAEASPTPLATALRSGASAQATVEQTIAADDLRAPRLRVGTRSLTGRHAAPRRRRASVLAFVPSERLPLVIETLAIPTEAAPASGDGGSSAPPDPPRALMRTGAGGYDVAIVGASAAGR